MTHACGACMYCMLAPLSESRIGVRGRLVEALAAAGGWVAGDFGPPIWQIGARRPGDDGERSNGTSPAEAVAFDLIRTHSRFPSPPSPGGGKLPSGPTPSRPCLRSNTTPGCALSPLRAARHQAACGGGWWLAPSALAWSRCCSVDACLCVWLYVGCSHSASGAKRVRCPPGEDEAVRPWVRMCTLEVLDPPKCRCSMLPTSHRNVDNMLKCLLP